MHYTPVTRSVVVDACLPWLTLSLFSRFRCVRSRSALQNQLICGLCTDSCGTKKPHIMGSGLPREGARTLLRGRVHPLHSTGTIQREGVQRRCGPNQIILDICLLLCILPPDLGRRPRGRPKRTWREVVRQDCQARKLNRVDAIEEDDKGCPMIRMGVSG